MTPAVGDQKIVSCESLEEGVIKLINVAAGSTERPIFCQSKGTTVVYFDLQDLYPRLLVFPPRRKWKKNIHLEPYSDFEIYQLAFGGWL